MSILFNILNLTSKYSKLLIGMSIGIGLGLFLILSVSFMGFLLMPIALAGLVAFVMGVLWFFIERKKIGFGVVASVLTIVLMPIATIPLYTIYVLSLGVFLQASFDGLALLFLGSGFLAFGLIGVYIEKRPKKLGFFFMVLSLLFLIGVPLANEYNVLATRWFTWIATPYEGYTIPLILVSFAFFLLGCVLIFYKKSWEMKKWLIDIKTIKLDKIKQDFTREKQEIEIRAKKFGVTSHNVGFICLILSSLSLIGAAAVYAPNGPSPLVWGIMGAPSRECTLALIIMSGAFFAMGFTFLLYTKSKRPGFFLGASGSLTLMFAAFTHAYRNLDFGGFFNGEPVFYYNNPFREYTFPIIIVGVVLVIFGYALLLRKVGFGVKF
jgi:hypothetical protein